MASYTADLTGYHAHRLADLLAELARNGTPVKDEDDCYLTIPENRGELFDVAIRGAGDKVTLIRVNSTSFRYSKEGYFRTMP